MNMLLLKQIGIFSLLVGVIVGVLTLIPFIGSIVFTLYFIALAAGVIIYLKKNGILGDLSIKEGGVIGAVIGFSSFVAFSCVFVPLATLLSFIFNSWAGSVIRTCLTSGATFVLLLFLLFFVALLCALMNCFSGAVTIYVYEVLAGLKHDEDNFQNYFNK